MKYKPSEYREERTKEPLDYRDELLFLFNCGLSYKDLESISHKGEQTLRKNIERVRTEEDKELASKFIEREFKGIETYLRLYNSSEETYRDKNIFNALHEYIMTPIIEKIKTNTNLVEILKPINLFEKIIYELSELNPEGEILKVASSVIDIGGVSTKKELIDEVTKMILNKIKTGDYTFNLTGAYPELSVLSLQERKVLELGFCYPTLNMVEIGKELGVSKSRIGQIVEDISDKLSLYAQSYPLSLSESAKRMKEDLRLQEERNSRLETKLRFYENSFEQLSQLESNTSDGAVESYHGILRELSGKIEYTPKGDMLKYIHPGTKISVTNLSIRAKNFCDNLGISTAEELREVFEEEGKQIQYNHHNLGERTFQEIENFVKSIRQH